MDVLPQPFVNEWYLYANYAKQSVLVRNAPERQLCKAICNATRQTSETGFAKESQMQSWKFEITWCQAADCKASHDLSWCYVCPDMIK